MKENSGVPRMKLGFHKFYTYIFLPLSIAFAFFVSYGRFVDVLVLQLYNFQGVVESIHTLLPFYATLADLIVLIGLLCFSKAGRTTAMANALLQGLLALFFIVADILFHGFAITPYLIAYTLLALFSCTVFFWYLRHSFYFPRGGRSWKETREAYEAQFHLPEEEKEPETAAEPVPEEEEPEEVVEENPEEPEAEEAEEPEEEEYTPEEEDGEEADPVCFAPWTVEESEGQAKKLYAIMESMFSPLSPLQILSTDLKVMEGKTEVIVNVVSRSAQDIAKEDWVMNGKYHFHSEVLIPSGSKGAVKAIVNEEMDRVKPTLVAVEDIDGDRTELDVSTMPLWPMPEKVLLTSLSKDDRYQWFLRDYLASTAINARYVASGNIFGKAVTCPVCGNPVAKDEKYCPVCGLSAHDRALFEKDTLMASFHLKSNI